MCRFKRVASKDDKVRRSQAKRRLAGKTPGSMEEKLSTPELNTPLKLARLNEIPDGPMDMVTVSSTVVRNLVKRKAVKRGDAPRSITSVSVNDSSKRRKVTSPTKSQEVLKESDKIAEVADLRPRFEVEAGLLEEQCRAKAREKMVVIMDDEFKKVDGAGKEDLPARGGKKPVGREPDSGEGSFPVGAGERKGSCCPKAEGSWVESEAKVEQLVIASAISQNNLAGKFYQLRYTKAKIMAFSEGNYEEMEIMDEKEKIESSCLRVVDLEGLLEVEKKSSAELQKELDVAREREEQTLLYNVEYAEEYEVLFSQELTELKEKVVSGSRHEAELAEYRVRALNEEISDMKCEGSREMKEFLRRKDELVGNMRIDLTNSRQESIDLTRKMCERIDQVIAELAELKARRLMDNKRAAVTHQAFKELVVHEQDKYDGEALHQRQLSALVAFFVEEIKFLQVERDLMQDCFSGKTCVCKHDISSINPIGVMDRGIGTMTAEQIA
ncbi:hypothetical protein GIB67_025100 [Kingdonia uniflora]|uniref:Uncharacterized protein n=1 Tax=Kingdonia uniflora TaxID=39325 RepID=A0A7J7N7X7_9MAGN|nr:hypothetical protein GIB67_025100 [Kingdonia uniflora]